jgi:hypothetical protein
MGLGWKDQWRRANDNETGEASTEGSDWAMLAR